MYATDFQYAGQYLSDYGFIICDFNASGGTEITETGSQITFNTVSTHGGRYWALTNTAYDTCLTATFDICKNPCTHNEIEISDIEYRMMMRWLNRRKFCELSFIWDDSSIETCHYEASFNVSRIEINGVLYGLELEMTTNRPFGYGDTIKRGYVISEESNEIEFYDISDVPGYSYPDITVTCLTKGDLQITNNTESSVMRIENCTAGEVIKMHGAEQMIETSLAEHAIYNDFNFEFLRIGNAPDNQKNEIIVSLPCLIEISYSPSIYGIF